MENTKQMQALLKEAQDSFASKNYPQTHKICCDLLEKYPDCLEAYFMIANVFHLRGELGKAIKSFQKVLSLDPHHTDAAISLSVILNDIGRYEEAREIFEKANYQVKNSKHQGLSDPHLNKKFALRHLELAELYMTYNRFDEALFEYNKSIALDPENLEVRIKVAKVYAKKGFTAKASDELKRLKAEHPHFIPARMALGLIYYGSGLVLEAQTEWQFILNREPQHPEAQMYLNLSKGATETRLSQ